MFFKSCKYERFAAKKRKKKNVAECPIGPALSKQGPRAQIGLAAPPSSLLSAFNSQPEPPVPRLPPHRCRPAAPPA